MKYIIVMFSLFSLNAKALTLIQERSVSEGISQVKYSFESSRIIKEKRSNFFDFTKSFSLGSFTSSSKELSQWKITLESALKTIKTTDSFLKSKGADFNSLSGKLLHRSYLVLDGFIITQDSNQYKALKAVLDGVEKLNWKQESGIIVNQDLKTFESFSAGKSKGSEKFDMAFRCQKPKAPTVCGFKDLGILYIE